MCIYYVYVSVLHLGLGDFACSVTMASFGAMFITVSIVVLS